MAKEITSETMDRVVAIYEDTQSLKETARQAEISVEKVRKILLTRGLWTSKRAEEVRTLSDQGLSVQEISEKLNINPISVYSYMPYEKGLYNEPDKSDNAVRIEQMRERRSDFAEKQPVMESDSFADMDKDELLNLLERYRHEQMGYTTKHPFGDRKQIEKLNPKDPHDFEVLKAALSIDILLEQKSFLESVSKRIDKRKKYQHSCAKKQHANGADGQLNGADGQLNGADGQLNEVDGQKDFVLSKPYYTSLTNHTAEVYRLKLELIGSRKEEFAEHEGGYTIGGQTEKEWKILQKYGNVNEAISREVLVNSLINLRQLHFIIQMLFGWRHSHLHEFTLTEDDLNKFVKTGQDYLDMCGIYFRFPIVDFDDDFWDDDYEEYMNPKTWMKNKYKHPMDFPGISDEFLENQRMVEEWVDWVYEMRKGMIHYSPNWYEQQEGKVECDVPLARCSAEQLFTAHFEKNPQALREHLRLHDLLAYGKTDEKTRKYKAQTTVLKLGPEFYEFGLDSKEGINVLKQLLESQTERVNDSLDEYKEVAEDFKEWFYNEDHTDEDQDALEGYLEELGTYFMDAVSIPLPIVKTLYYNYDFGDNWWVKITVEDVYSLEDIAEVKDEEAHKEMAALDGEDGVVFFDKNCRYVDGDMNNLVKRVWAVGNPVCIAKDGLNVLDDVGGIEGYIRFLKELHEGDKDERKETKEWARSQGWTGRDMSLKNML